MSRREAGRRGRDRGLAWEREIERGLALLAREGRVCCWWRQEPPVRVTRGGIIRTAVGPPDYVIATPTTTWAVEAKRVDGPRLPWGRIAAHQAHALTAWASAPGRRSGLLLRYSMRDRIGDADVLVDWAEVAGAWVRWAHGDVRRGAASLSVDIALALGVTPWTDGL